MLRRSLFRKPQSLKIISMVRKPIYQQHKRSFLFRSLFNWTMACDELKEIRNKYKNGEYEDAYHHLHHVFEQAKKSGLTSAHRSEALTLSAKVQLKRFSDPDVDEIKGILNAAIKWDPSNQEAKMMLDRFNKLHHKNLSP